MKKTDEAVTIFELDVDAYPRSGDAFAWAKPIWPRGIGRKAIASYKKSLELNPVNFNAVEQLKKLGGE